MILFCASDNLTEEAIYASQITEKVSLVSENDVRSENYAVEASKHGKMEKYEFGREKPAESIETIHKTIRHDATTDSIERTKENDQKLVERWDFEACGVDDCVMVFASSEKFLRRMMMRMMPISVGMC